MKRIMVLFLSVLFMFGCQEAEQTFEKEPPQIESAQDVKKRSGEERVKSELIERRETTITVGAVGDVLLHDRVYDLAKVGEGKYDFSPMLEEVEELLMRPDFLMANMESMPGGVDIGLSGYPAFNSPKEIVTNLQDVGVDMLIGANNHTIDRGLRAVENAINFYDEVGMDYVGVYRDEEDRQRDRIVEIEDISIGVLAYTYGTNGIPIPTGHEYVVSLIDKERIAGDVENLKEKVDVLVVHMHWGPEYVREPDQQQRQLAQYLAELEVDIVFGHHPHVLQPIDVIVQEESGHETTVFYSLGNFFSGQYFDFTDIGGLGTVEITKVTEGDETDISIVLPQIEPTVVILEDNLYRVKPMIGTDGSPITGSTYEEMVEHTLLYLEEEN
ncbi:CapA family protein [Evansella sp. AB-P1]|uniref:CapA family protein n=1 Tax=Evansella sp. AB-P1 TaxID=3037653 RepID=UPI00241C8C32|nr:CapA family protein [Evansella sp. AB-P1]MDG5790050.1 CapA family protein [Evansella sp. AB-P1]